MDELPAWKREQLAIQRAIADKKAREAKHDHWLQGYRVATRQPADTDRT